MRKVCRILQPTKQKQFAASLYQIDLSPILKLISKFMENMSYFGTILENLRPQINVIEI